MARIGLHFSTIAIALGLTSVGVISVMAMQSQSAIPYGDLGATFHIKEINYVYPSAYHSLRDIYFGNLSIHLAGDSNGILLKNGKYVKRDLVYRETTLRQVHHLTGANSQGVEQVLLLLDDFTAGGSSGLAMIAQLLELSNERLRIVQEIGADLHYGGPLFAQPFNAATKTLVIHSAHYLPGDAHCCVSAMDVITFKWNGSRFVQTSFATELTASGKRQGKKLRP